MPECGRFDAYCRLVFQASAKIEGAQNFEDPIAKCIYCAIKMSLRDCYPAYKFLGLDVLREGYRLGKYRKSVLDAIFELTQGRDLVELLVMINPSLPCPYILRKLVDKWSKIRQDCIRLINAEETNPTDDGKRSIRMIFRFWLRCLKAHMLIKDQVERQFALLQHEIKETIMFLRLVLESGAPDCTLNGYISILQKIVEVTLYDTWTFGVNPKEGQSQRHIAIGSLVKSTEPLYRERSRHLDNEFFQAEHFIRMYMYTVIRTVYALCPNEKRWLLRINFPVGVLLDVFLPTKTLLFRALYTLLKLEWKARYLSVRYDYAPSYWLFANLMSKYDFNCEELANDLMPFETDGMQYILAFVSRVLSSRWEPRTNTSDGPPYYMPPDFISRYGQEIRQLFITIAQKLEATYIELGMSPEEYPNTIYHLREAAGKLP